MLTFFQTTGGKTLIMFIPLIGVIATVFLNIAMKIFDTRWRRNSRAFSELLDISKKMDKPSPRIKELLELHEARFLIENERIHVIKSDRYYSKHGVSSGFRYFLLKWGVIRVFSTAIGVSVGTLVITTLIYFFVPSTQLVGFWHVGMNVFIGMVTLQVSVDSILAALELLFRGKKGTVKYKATLLRRAIGILRPSETLKIKSLHGSERIYDYIGIPQPHNGSLDLFRLSSSAKEDGKEVQYVYQTTRQMTILEIEWLSELNAISTPFRRSVNYIPYVKDDGHLSNSAYYLVRK